MKTGFRIKLLTLTVEVYLVLGCVQKLPNWMLLYYNSKLAVYQIKGK